MEPSAPALPTEVLYGTQTELGVRNFGSSRRRLADVPTLIKNYALVKAAAAQANAAVGTLDAERADAIRAAAAEVAEGRHNHQFPTALVVGGGGTTTNMNMNEVLATRAAQIAGVEIHPNDHVNASQSTNDTYPTAMALTVRELAGDPLDAIEELASAFDDKAIEFDEVVRLGRTCLQDAVTLTVGDTHKSHATVLRRVVESLRAAVDELQNVPLGATVLGTGIGASPEYRKRVVGDLSQLVGGGLRESHDKFDALAHLDPYAAIASAGARAAISMAKIAADLRLLSSGPNGGFAEITLPAVQAGSSIMPGKVNPVVPEYVMQLSYRARGASHVVEAAVAAGELELNIMEPIIVDSLIDIFEDLTSAARVFADHCVRGISWNGSRLRSSAEAGYDRWVTIAAEEGYDSATQQVRGAGKVRTL